MPDRLRYSSARIRRADTVIGTGLLIAAQHVLTCAHVVNMALGRNAMATSLPTKPLALDFIMEAGQPRYSATIGGWSAPANDSPDDFALLILDRPPGAPISPVNTFVSTPPADSGFATFGFPSGLPGGLSLGGVVGRPQGFEWLQVYATPGRPPIVGGFSGAGVWDLDEEAIAGILVARKVFGNAEVNFVLPSSLIHRFLSTLTPPLTLAMQERTVRASVTGSTEGGPRVHIIPLPEQGKISWDGDISPVDIPSHFSHTRLHLGIRAQVSEVRALAPAILRLAAHGAGGILYATDEHDWFGLTQRILSSCMGTSWTTRGPSKDGPNESIWGLRAYRDFAAPRHPAHHFVCTVDELAEDIHRQLDRYVYNALATQIDALLTTRDVNVTSIEIAPDVAEVMIHIWRKWDVACADDPLLPKHLFEYLLVTADRCSADAGHCRLGPRTLHSCILRSVIYCLGLAAGLEGKCSPARGLAFHNFKVWDTWAHLCGLELVQNVRLDQKIRELRWQTPLVLVPNFTGNPGEIRAMTRGLAFQKPRTFLTGPFHSGPLLLSGNWEFWEAIRSGIEELRAHVRKLFRSLAEDQSAAVTSPLAKWGDC